MRDFVVKIDPGEAVKVILAGTVMLSLCGSLAYTVDPDWLYRGRRLGTVGYGIQLIFSLACLIFFGLRMIKLIRLMFKGELLWISDAGLGGVLTGKSAVLPWPNIDRIELVSRNTDPNSQLFWCRVEHSQGKSKTLIQIGDKTTQEVYDALLPITAEKGVKLNRRKMTFWSNS